MIFSIKRNIKFSFTYFALLLGAGLIPGATVEAIGVGAKPSSFATPLDAFSGVTNPALAVLVEDRCDLSGRWYNNPMHGSVAGNLNPAANVSVSASSKRENFFFVDGALHKTFKTCIFDHRLEWSLSFAAFTETWVETTYKDPYVLAGTTPPSTQHWDQTYVPVFSLKINDRHTVGISIDILGKRTNVKGFEFSDTPENSVAPGFVTNKGNSLSWGVMPTFGWRWKVNDALRIGVVYRPRIKMSRFKAYKGLYPDLGRSDSPQRAGIGIAFAFSKSFGTAFDFEWTNYKNVQVHNRFTRAFKLGSPNGSYQGFRDRFAGRLSLSYLIFEGWTVRCGYQLANKVVPRSQTLVNLNICESTTSSLYANTTYAWGRNELTLLYGHGVGSSILGRNSIPASLGGGEASFREIKHTVALGWGYKY